MLLGAVFWLTGSSLVAGRLLNLVIGVGVVVLTMRVGRMVATPPGRPGRGPGRGPLPAAHRQRHGAAGRARLAAADPRAGAGPRPPTGGRWPGCCAGCSSWPARPPRASPWWSAGWLIWQLGWKRCAAVPGRGRDGGGALGGAQLGPARFPRAGDLERLQHGRHLLARRPRQTGRFRRPGLRPARSSGSAWPSSTRSAGSATCSTWPRVASPAPEPGRHGWSSATSAAHLRAEPSVNRLAEIWDGRNLSFVDLDAARRSSWSPWSA